jgi:hypothetical protein
MRIDETPDHAIQEAVEDFRKRLGSAPQKETSIACSENGSQRRAEAVDPEKAFREKWLSLSWEEIGGLLFERELDLGLEEEAYYMYAFGGLPFRKMVAKLAEMVTGQRSVDIHWPLVGQVLTSLFSKRARGADKEAIANLAIRALSTLSVERQSLIRKLYLKERCWQFLESPAEPWLLAVVNEISGGVIEGLVSDCWLENYGIMHWLGMNQMESVLLRLDYRKSPDRISRDILGESLVEDGAPSVTLFMDRLKDQAPRSATRKQIALWQEMVFINKVSALVYLLAEDESGRRNPAATREWTTLVADFITYRWALKNGCETLFDKFMRAQQRPNSPGGLRTCSVEVFRFYLWLLRGPREHPNVVKNATSIREAYPQFPEPSQSVSVCPDICLKTQNQ